MKLLYPVAGKPSISQKYGNKSGFYSDFHRGVDFRTWQYEDFLDRRVISVHEGTVIYTDTKSTGNTYYHTGVQGSHYGVHCIVQFEHEAEVYYLLYAHMNQLDVQRGQRVKAGDILGVSGNTGYSTRGHVHFELRKGLNKRSASIDPTEFFVEKLVEEIPDWAQKAWQWAKENSITSKYSTFVEDGRLMIFLKRFEEHIFKKMTK